MPPPPPSPPPISFRRLTSYLKTTPSICSFSDQIVLDAKIEIFNESGVEASHQSLRPRVYWSKCSPLRQPHSKNCICWKSSWRLFQSLSQEQNLKYVSCSEHSNKPVTLSALTDSSHLIAVHLLLKKTSWQKPQLRTFITMFYHCEIK